MKTKRLTLPEDRLIAAIREQHPEGLRALYDMYSASLFGVISRIIPDQQISEDVLQETFIRIWQSFSQYNTERGRLFTWMVNIARNMAIDQLRMKSYRNATQTVELDACHDQPQAEKPYPSIDALFLRDGLKNLKPNEMLVIDLVYYKGYTHLEAAEELGMPLGSVKTRIMSAIRRLRQRYAADLWHLAS